jgi:UDP-GlcNAc:undecaprenyl-phosphate GlcNAc-1-phosphate transferase
VSLTPYLVVFGATFAVAFLMTPLVRKLAIRVNAVDRPSDRKVHPRPTPTMGGLARFVAVVAGLVVAHQLHFFRALFRTSSEPTGVLVACAVVVAIGAYDDVRGTAVPVKLAGQLMAAGLLVLFGVQLLYFFFPGQGILVLGSDLAVPLTVIWVVGMVNAVNLIDGLDGLAAGMVGIAALAFFGYVFLSPSPFGPSFETGSSTAALLSALAAGGALGFLPWNFHPARIFMGDSGAMLLGILLAAATVSGVGRTFVSPSRSDLAAFSIPVLVPLVILAVPLLDVAFAIFRRMRRGAPVTHADKEHIHHRLMDFGHSHRQAVLLMYLWSALISGSALAVALLHARFIAGVIALGAFLVIVGTAIPRAWPRIRAARRSLASDTSTPPTTVAPPAGVVPPSPPDDPGASLGARETP